MWTLGWPKSTEKQLEDDMKISKQPLFSGTRPCYKSQTDDEI